MNPGSLVFLLVIPLILIAPRGIYIKRETPVMLDQAVKNMVQRNLDIGNAIKLSAKDLVRMYESGSYVVPSRIDVNNRLSLHAYCCGILHDLELNHGTTKEETCGYGMVYEFQPNMIQKVKA